jgi:hypothetical protein
VKQQYSPACVNTDKNKEVSVIGSYVDSIVLSRMSETETETETGTGVKDI